jgi:hypothetical protein
MERGRHDDQLVGRHGILTGNAVGQPQAFLRLLPEVSRECPMNGSRNRMNVPSHHHRQRSRFASVPGIEHLMAGRRPFPRSSSLNRDTF